MNMLSNCIKRALSCNVNKQIINVVKHNTSNKTLMSNTDKRLESLPEDENNYLMFIN